MVKGGEHVSSSFSCDLIEQSKKHVLFLQTLHLCGITVNRPNAESLRRYSELWLPLVHRQYISNKNHSPKERLVPPADISWLWHCHRLAPYRYSKYVQKRFFGLDRVSETFPVLDADFPFVLQLVSDEGGNINATSTVHMHPYHYHVKGTLPYPARTNSSPRRQ